jgi:hypothetical protein
MALSEMLSLTASIFLKGLFGFLGRVLDGSSVIVERHDYHEVAGTAKCR